MKKRTLDGRFQLDDELGSGGFGVVFAASELGTGRKVAVKVFRPQGNNKAHEDALERFKREGEMSERLTHENAIKVFEHGVAKNGTPFIVMELLHGHNLAVELKRHQRLPYLRVLELLERVSSALAAAHALSIVHRDVKPENVFLHQEGAREVVKVLDFGVAKSTELSVSRMPLTLTGALVGTPHYVAPERVEGEDYDGRADVYSVGVMMYQLLAGQLPFGSASFYSAVMAHVEAPIPDLPPELDDDVPKEVEALAQLAMTKNPKKRPTAEAFAAKLSKLRKQLSQGRDRQ